MIKIAVLGYGGRGKLYSYLTKITKNVKVSAVCDINTQRLARAKKAHKLPDNMLFTDYDAMLKAEKVADVLFICTQDAFHYEHAMKALDAGYDIVLEKPVSPDIKECLAIEKKALESGRKVDVCHVLRYTDFYKGAKSVIDSGVLGKIISIDMAENIGYYHYAHSYVRGDWRNRALSSPMILAKCCHDMDIAVYLSGSNCEKVNSFGELTYFKRENAPEGSADRCLDGCKVKDKCPYDAEKIYLERYKKFPKFIGKHMWPCTRIVPDGIPTEESLTKALKDGPFGRCVYKCDNDVADYQSTQIKFENGINCTLLATAFSNKIYRQLRVRGTMGEIIGDMIKNELYYQPYGKKKEEVKLGLISGIAGHGGGDRGLINQFSRGELETDITKSIESHLMAMAAEESRVNGGATVYIREFKAGLQG